MTNRHTALQLSSQHLDNWLVVWPGKRFGNVRFSSSFSLSSTPCGSHLQMIQTGISFNSKKLSVILVSVIRIQYYTRILSYLNNLLKSNLAFYYKNEMNESLNTNCSDGPEAANLELSYTLILPHKASGCFRM